ncbi:MAG: HD-GYP domain-containing protein [Halarcobacter sp.]
MDKKKEILFNLNNFLISTSSALDAVETDIYKTTEAHSKKVAFIALKLAKEFNYEPEGLSDICSYSLLHNIALYKTRKKDKDYCELGQKLVDNFPFLGNEKDIIKYQLEYYNGSGPYGLKADEIPLISQFLAFATIIDEKFDLSKKEIDNRNHIIKYVKENENILFSSDIVECFCEFSENQSFWLDLQNEHELLTYIFTNLHDFSTPISFEELLNLTRIFTDIIENNSSLIKNSEKMLDFYDFEHKDRLTFLIAASLTNLGKFFIPYQILNKDSELSEDEYEIIKSYPYYTKRILSNIMGFNDITTWASKTQEFIDGTGYPYCLKGKDLSFKDRLMIILNIYSALSSNKTYRQAFDKNEAFKILDELVENSKIDKAIVNDLKEVFE